MTPWDHRFVALAEHIASWSKDPSTKIGAVVVDPATRLVKGMGYNGFPRGVDDDPERYADRAVKYPLVVHAELNAILNTVGGAAGCTIYIWPLFSCGECAKAVVQSGIKKVVAKRPIEERWASHYEIAQQIFAEAGVEVEFAP